MGENKMLNNSAGDNPYLFECPWCGAVKGCLCKNPDGIEYKDGSYHRARLMKDCLEFKAKEDTHESIAIVRSCSPKSTSSD